MINTIVLTAGRFDPKNTSDRMINDVGLVPIHGKISISWVLDSILKNGSDKVKVVLSKSNKKLRRFLENYYPQIERYYNSEESSLIFSLYIALNTCDDNTPIQIILGDTFINEKFPIEENVLLVSGKIKSSKQWCLVSNDENSNLKDIFNTSSKLSELFFIFRETISFNIFVSENL